MNSRVYNACVATDSAIKEFLRAGQLARLAGVSTDTLRHYERKGVLPIPRRTANGYRQYPHQALERVRLIKRALAIGFTLDELASILKVRDRGGAPCKQVRLLAAAKLSDVEARLREMIAIRDELRATLQDWDARLSKASTGARAGLLEALAAEGATKAGPTSHLSSPFERKKKGITP